MLVSDLERGEGGGGVGGFRSSRCGFSSLGTTGLDLMSWHG